MKKVVYFITLILLVFCCSIQASPINVNYTIKTDTGRTTISKYVYGSNWGNDPMYTVQRLGGNRCTAYNWENNWSNAGSDWYFENDQMFDPCAIPGKGVTDDVNIFTSQNQETIVTLQLAGYVSAPIFGMNLDQYPPPSQYFYPVQFAKGAPFCNPPGNPDVCDGVVYMDEFVNLLVSKYGPAGSPQGVKFYCLDNEVDIWHATHKEVHPAHILCQELKNKSVACATAVKNVDPNCEIMGPVLCTFVGFQSLDNAPDWSSVKGSRPWFISYYLDEMRIASNAAGKRLLDVLDVHWYPPEDDGNGHGICDDIEDARVFNARMQAPRTLWDTGYVYPNMTYPNGGSSWVNKSWNAQFLPVLTRFKADIQNYFPDTNIAITEYVYGPAHQWATGITTADFLGICGKYGVYITNYWGQGGYIDTAVKIYRNYDGFHSTYGDTNVPATMSDKVNSSIYASISDSNNVPLHIIVLNKNQDNDINGTFTLTSSHSFSSGRVFAFDANSSNIREITPIPAITGNTFVYAVPKKSVCHIVLDGPPCQLQYDLTGDCIVNRMDLDVFVNQWLTDCTGETDCTDFNGDLNVDFTDLSLFSQEWRIND